MRVIVGALLSQRETVMRDFVIACVCLAQYCQRAFVGAFLKGLKDTIANPDDAFELSASHIPNFADLNADVQWQVIDVSTGQWQAQRLGYSDPQAWENMQNVLLDMGLLAEKMDLSKAFTNEFIP